MTTAAERPIIDDLRAYLQAGRADKVLEVLGYLHAAREETAAGAECREMKGQLRVAEERLARLGEEARPGHEAVTKSLHDRIIVHLYNYFSADQTYDPVRISEQVPIEFTLEELRGELIELTRANGAAFPLEILRLLLNDTRRLLRAEALDERLDLLAQAVRAERITEPLEWQDRRTQLDKTLIRLIGSLEEEELILPWRSTYFRLVNGVEKEMEAPRYAIFPAVRAVEKEAWSSEDYQENLLLYQDYFRARDYRLAYERAQALQAMTAPDNLEVYGWLTAAYFKCVEATVIEDVLETAAIQPLNYLLTYAARLRDDEADEARYVHRAARANRAEIRRGLYRELYRAYAAIDVNALNRAGEDPAHQITAVRCLRAAARVARFLGWDRLMSRLILNELAGGGKFSWIKLDDDGRLTNVLPPDRLEDFDALRFRDRLLDDLAAAGRLEAGRAAARQTAAALLTVYSRIHPRESDSCYAAIEAVLARCYLAGILYPSHAGFFTLILRELSGHGKLNWFDLGPNRSLRAVAVPHAIDPRDLYRQTAMQVLGPADGREQERELLSRAYARLKDHSLAVYAGFRIADYAGQRIGGHSMDDLADNLRDLYTCFTYGGADRDLFSDMIVRELTGHGHVAWYGLREGKFVPRREKLTDFDPDDLLAELLERSLGLTVEKLDSLRADAAFGRLVKPTYQALLEKKNTTFLSGLTRRQAVWRLLGYAADFIALAPHETYFEFLWQEIINERIFSWIDVEEKQLIPIREAVEEDFDPLELLRSAAADMNLDPTEVDLHIMQRIVQNRYEAVRYVYDTNFSKIKRYNNSIEHRIEMIELLDTCRAYFELTGDYRYLELPYKEYVSGLGRIRWTYQGIFRGVNFSGRFLHIFEENWRNHEIADFDFGAERAFISAQFRHQNGTALTAVEIYEFFEDRISAPDLPSGLLRLK